MEKIASFMVDHDVLKPGLYLSRVDGSVNTYDMRFTKPNVDFIPQAALHTLEHLYATILRSSRLSAHIIYFGPMGCRTGCYLITQALPHKDAINLLVDATRRVSEWVDKIPGDTSKECGNYLEHDLDTAKSFAAGYLPVIEFWTQDRLEY